MGLGVLGLRPRASGRQTGWCAHHDGQRAGLVPAGGLGQLHCGGRVGRSDLRTRGRKSRRRESGAGEDTEERDIWAARAAAPSVWWAPSPSWLCPAHTQRLWRSREGPEAHLDTTGLFTDQPAPKGHHTIVPSHQEPELPLPPPLPTPSRLSPLLPSFCPLKR